MNMFDDSEIIVTVYDGKEIKIPYKNVKNLQECFGVHPIDVGGMSIAGPKKEYVKIETFDGKTFEIPRASGNDTEILSFVLRWRKR
ncbi:hypothetical protein [Salinicola sp. RZ23]|uniref:hypothetical protein n=1 Tax=Salinicola sp. RZ23 TaxID=1949087 RepID=UPI0013001C95|nr:hypothetical protein [Salinicola sp. RZ23]